MERNDRPRLDLTVCPECAAPAEIAWTQPDIDPDLAVAYVRCLFRHWFLMPVDQLRSPARRLTASAPDATVQPLGPCRTRRR